MSYTGLRATGRNATAARPADVAQAVPGDTWFKDRSGPGKDDGTELDATFANRVKALLEAMFALGGDPASGDDQLADAVAAYVADQLGDYAPLDGPLFTGNARAPTVDGSSDSSQKIATTAFVQQVRDALRSEIYGGTPSALLDTITELAAELASDSSAIAALTSAIAGKQAAHGLLTALSALTIAKGTLVVGSGAAALAALGVGSDGEVLTADSAQANGMKWAAPGSAPVSSVFGRTGGVAATAGDYNASKIDNDSSAIGTHVSDALTNLHARGKVYWTASRSTTQPGALLADGSAYNRVTYAGLFAELVKSATVTISIASPGVVTWTGHGLRANEVFKATTTGALPTGLTAGTTYYVKTVIDANTFTLSATAGGSAINTSGTQSGVHTGISAPFGDGNGSTTFNVPNLCDGSTIRGLDLSGANDANRTFGSSQADQMQGHLHNAPVGGYSGTPYGMAQTAYCYNYCVDSGATSTPISDGTNGSPRTGKETRMRNVALLPYIRY